MLATTTINFLTKLLIGAVFSSVIAFFAPFTATAQTTPRPCFDFTGSGRTSFATVTRGTQSITWRILGNGGSTGGGLQTVQYGLSGVDFLTPGYFDNDNRADLNVYRTTASTYFPRPSTSTIPNSFQAIPFGMSGDIPGLEADYDGDGRDDLTIVRDGGNRFTWFFLRSSNNTVGVVNFGTPGSTGGGDGDIPIAGADYNGDGRADLTVIRTNLATGGDTYFVGDSTTGATLLVQPWGEFDTDFYVVGDYLGDRRADFAVYRAFAGGLNGVWFIRENGGSGTVIRPFGFTSVGNKTTDHPICGDYNGDGKQDIAIYRSSNSSFYWLNSPGFNTFSGIRFGQPGDFPVAGLRSF